MVTLIPVVVLLLHHHLFLPGAHLFVDVVLGLHAPPRVYLFSSLLLQETLTALPVSKRLDLRFLSELAFVLLPRLHISERGHSLRLFEFLFHEPLIHGRYSTLEFSLLALGNIEQVFAHLVLRLANQFALQALLGVFLLKPLLIGAPFVISAARLLRLR